MGDTPRPSRPGAEPEERLSETVRERAEAKETSDDPGEIRDELAAGGPGKAESTSGTVRRFLRRRPLKAVGAALGLGLLAGWLTRR